MLSPTYEITKQLKGLTIWSNNVEKMYVVPECRTIWSLNLQFYFVFHFSAYMICMLEIYVYFRKSAPTLPMENLFLFKAEFYHWSWSESLKQRETNKIQRPKPKRKTTKQTNKKEKNLLRLICNMNSHGWLHFV